MWEFSSGELVHITHRGVKRRTAIGCPQQRMPSPVPLGRLCSDPTGSGRPMGAALVSLGSPTNSPKAELPPAQVCPHSLQPVVIQSLTKEIPEGFGYLGSLHRLHHGIKLHWAHRALVFGILRLFWASCPGCVLILPHPCLGTCWPVLQPGQAELPPPGCHI